VLHERVALVGCQRPGNREDRFGHLELADVVHQRAPVDLADLVFGQVCEHADANREVGDPL
jgi:hypothetical protein